MSKTLTKSDNHSFNQQGYILKKQFFSKQEMDAIREGAQRVFLSAIHQQSWHETTPLPSETEVTQAMFSFFRQNLPAYIQCGSTCQNLIALHRLSLQEKVLQTLKQLGIGSPNICTRPVLYFNSPHMAKEEFYYKTPAHQDWRSMQGSLNAIVVWAPLVDIDIPLGALEVIPGSHLQGLRSSVDDPFYQRIEDIPDHEFIPVEVKKGDALFFSSFLIHRSGNNQTHQIRWSCHFRYNDLEEPTFIQRHFPSPYQYKPQKELITANFPSRESINAIYKPPQG